MYPLSKKLQKAYKEIKLYFQHTALNMNNCYFSYRAHQIGSLIQVPVRDISLISIKRQ